VTCWLVIPAKTPGAAKTRLAGVLSPSGRAQLSAAMLQRVLAAAGAASGLAGISVIGAGPDGAGEVAELLADPQDGLNAALGAARTVIAGRGAGRLVTLAADLPLVTAADVAALVDLPGGVIGIAPDRHGAGTNALSLPLPAALGFAYGHGPGSLARHVAEAARLGLEARLIDRPGLARDVDEPCDLADAAGLLSACSDNALCGQPAYPWPDGRSPPHGLGPAGMG
jgi:2-phospho-L-lactate guanylyltransferase